jgi:hypothetical protein
MLEQDWALSDDSEKDNNDYKSNRHEEAKWKIYPIDTFAHNVTSGITRTIPLTTNNSLIDPREVYSSNPTINKFLDQSRVDAGGNPQVIVPPGIKLTANRWYHLSDNGDLTTVIKPLLTDYSSDSSCSTCPNSLSPPPYSPEHSATQTEWPTNNIEIQTDIETNDMATKTPPESDVADADQQTEMIPRSHQETSTPTVMRINVHDLIWQ